MRPGLRPFCAVILCALTLAAALAPRAAAQATPGKGLRTLILVRHGVYDENDARDAEIGKALLPEGREQARLTGARLAAWPARVDVVHASPMTRARETAEIIARSLPGRSPGPDRDLRECTPPTYREDVMADLEPGEADSCAARLDAVFARYFRPSPARDSTEVLVCHGNVIRWLTCPRAGRGPETLAHDEPHQLQPHRDRGEAQRRLPHHRGGRPRAPARGAADLVDAEARGGGLGAEAVGRAAGRRTARAPGRQP